ncbi:hypothetical protein ABZ532_17930 [Streptomyces sp. NPDC019396]|uniref:hypothetical protein n=1 Tax=Streptomyces sp. NPDC019396 TaxID=3154687 RepID=UPI0033C29640
MHVTRRTFRNAVNTAVAAGAVMALAIPAGAAFAEAGAGSGIESGPDEGRTTTGEGRAAKLADGSVARVYRLGPNHQRADIRDGRTGVGTLESAGAPALGRYHQLRVMLLPDGNVVSWLERGDKPGTARTSASAGVVMPDGRAVRLIEGDKPRAEVSSDTGRSLGTLTPESSTARYGGWTYKLVTDQGDTREPLLVVVDGRSGGKGWVFDFHGELIQTYRTR